MTIFTSLVSGVSGLNTNGNALSIIGDNIANMNTTGFKTSQPVFDDILSQSLVGATSSAGNQIGLGAKLAGVHQVFAQGGLQASPSITDLAINGKGFFYLRDATTGQDFYSRSGQFLVDKDGHLINANGFELQGYLADDEGTITGEMGTINLSSHSSIPEATALVNVVGNLDPETEAQPVGDFVPEDPFNTSHASIGVTVYDSQGIDHILQFFFCKTAANTWDVRILAKADEIDAAPAGDVYFEVTDPLLAGSRVLEFDVNGALASSPAFDAGGVLGGIDWLGDVSDGSMTFDFGTVGDTDGMTQYGQSTIFSSTQQDGHTAGVLVDFTIDKEGILHGIFSNGDNKNLAQVALASFQNEVGLFRRGGNLYIQTPDSGDVTLSSPEHPALGSINANFLEQSNVDMAAEFVRLITSQRAFQANSRVIGTTDTLLSEIVNLVR